MGRSKIKIGIKVPQGTIKWSVSFQFKRSKVIVTKCVGRLNKNRSWSLFGDTLYTFVFE